MAAPLVSSRSTAIHRVRDVRRLDTGTAYPSGTVTVTVRVYDPTGTTALQSEMNAAWDADANGYVAFIPPVPSGYSRVLLRETITANGVVLVTDVEAAVVR